ncbi:hypothetical protein GGX14DRAFT_398636 [Mycena pura]|uniref:Uncharacterized protein n=1 Tax=Mycena pura TaxID=153505 RepID=A0AAD6V9Z0_9AGAR|nr:hypothetical protein GGX14DRAFT_398636 [Mycena pura]
MSTGTRRAVIPEAYLGGSLVADWQACGLASKTLCCGRIWGGKWEEIRVVDPHQKASHGFDRAVSLSRKLWELQSQAILLLPQPELPHSDGGLPGAISCYQTTGISYPGYRVMRSEAIPKYLSVKNLAGPRIIRIKYPSKMASEADEASCLSWLRAGFETGRITWFTSDFAKYAMRNYMTQNLKDNRLIRSPMLTRSSGVPSPASRKMSHQCQDLANRLQAPQAQAMVLSLGR